MASNFLSYQAAALKGSDIAVQQMSMPDWIPQQKKLNLPILSTTTIGFFLTFILILYLFYNLIIFKELKNIFIQS